MTKRLRALAPSQIVGMAYSSCVLEDRLVQQVKDCHEAYPQPVAPLQRPTGMGHITGVVASIMIVLTYALELACKYVAEEEVHEAVGGHNVKQIYAMISQPERARIEQRYRAAVADAKRQTMGSSDLTRDIQKCVSEQRTIISTLRKLERTNIDWRYVTEKNGAFLAGTSQIGALIGWCKDPTVEQKPDLMISASLLRRAVFAILPRERVPRSLEQHT